MIEKRSKGDVRLGCPEDVASADLPNILAAFTLEHPNVRLHVRCDLTLHLVEHFDAGAFDLVIIKQDPHRIISGARSLREERLAWAGPGSQNGIAIDLCKKPVPLVLAPAPRVYRARAMEAIGSMGGDCDVVYASPSAAGQIAAVRAGLGWTMLQRRRIPTDLTAVTDEGWPPLPPAIICLLVSTYSTGAVETFARFVEMRFAHPHRQP
ncbi:MAG: hypothetical protein IBJ12_12715 [Sphingomonadaceae bacterium]|nr:hypothetical protein [Sphingomonadaceae bacterium]